MSYSELIVYTNNFNAKSNDLTKQLFRLLIYYVMKSSANYTDLPKLADIIKCDCDENSNVDEEAINLELADYYQNINNVNV